MRFPFTGVIPVSKPVGVTSRRVVDAVSRALGMRSVGHAGTLDPLAGGVVVVCVGHATKLVDHLHDLPKHYRATFLLGRSSASDDLETPVAMEEHPSRPSAAAVEVAAVALRGDILQRPCDYSAVHVDGRRAYRLARAGRTVALAAKPVHIGRLAIIGYEWPRLEVEIECSTGTFVRALGRDLAASLGTSAVTESLVRTAVGPFSSAASVALDALTPALARERLLPAAAAVAHLPQVVLGGAALAAAVRGGLVQVPAGMPAAVAALDADGKLVGVLKQLDGGGHRLRPNFQGAG